MNSPSRVSTAAGNSPAVAGGRVATSGTGAGFREALTSALGAGTGTEGQSSGGAHVVKRGETLYGIARNRLAAAGEATTPAAAMQYALDIARANHIRNPDRIQPGQQLHLGTGTSVRDGGSRSVESLAAAKRAWLVDEAAAAEIPDPTQPATAVTAAEGVQEVVASASSSACKTTDCGVGRSGAAERPGPDAYARPGDPSAHDGPVEVAVATTSRAVLALYEQTAPAPAPAPSPASGMSTAALLPTSEAPASKPAANIPDILYKGVVGKALDLVPLDPETRTGLQQANAVVSNSVVGRTLAALTGIGGPILTVAGLVWGLVSARKIGDMKPELPSESSRQVAQNTNASPLN